MSATGLLHDRVAVVTGGARGIGFAIGQRFVDEGAMVILADLVEESAVAAAARLGPRAHGIGVDVAREESVAAAADQVLADLGRIDCVVANAGILLLAQVLETDIDQWKRVLDVNLTGTFLTCRAFARPMVEAKRGGRIIMTSSLFGVRGGVENGAYAASKFGIIGFMQCLAAEMAPHGITVNAVCPGQVETDMIQQFVRERAVLTGSSEEAIRSRLLSRVPMGRMATIEEIADTFVFLASDLSGYITGQSLVVDGGHQVG